MFNKGWGRGKEAVIESEYKDHAPEQTLVLVNKYDASKRSDIQCKLGRTNNWVQVV